MLMIETLGIVVPRKIQKTSVCSISSGKGLVSSPGFCSALWALILPSAAGSPALFVTPVPPQAQRSASSVPAGKMFFPECHSTEECVPLYNTFTYFSLGFLYMNLSPLLVFFLRVTFLLMLLAAMSLVYHGHPAGRQAGRRGE